MEASGVGLGAVRLLRCVDLGRLLEACVAQHKPCESFAILFSLRHKCAMHLHLLLLVFSSQDGYRTVRLSRSAASACPFSGPS